MSASRLYWQILQYAGKVCMETLDLSSLLPKSVQFSPGIYPKDNFCIIPVFYPFSGCKKRCIFCAQPLQTGVGVISESKVVRHLEATLPAVASRPVEVAFYGGSFTLWPRAAQQACFERVSAAYAGQVAWRVRCSTRPASFGPGEEDPLEEDWLVFLRGLGLHLVEVGVQSFDDTALEHACRSYSGAAARQGCATVKRAGLRLGVQLMPGMPGVTPETFLRDVRQAIALKADCLRFYPCLVLEGTELAALWRRGEYTPWDLETTVRVLGEGLALCWQAGIPVIRIGLAPGPEMQAAVLAGPWHASLGNLVQSEALGLSVERCAQGRKIAALHLPRRCQGFTGGKHGRFRERLQGLGISMDAVFWHNQNQACVYFS